MRPSSVNDPGGLGQGPNSTYDPNYDWSQVYGSLTSTNNNAYASTGVIFRASQLPMAQVRDGASYTYLIGEHVTSIRIATIRACVRTTIRDGTGSCDWDINHWTHDPPSQDRAGVEQRLYFRQRALGRFQHGFLRRLSRQDQLHY